MTLKLKKFKKSSSLVVPRTSFASLLPIWSFIEISESHLKFINQNLCKCCPEIFPIQDTIFMNDS